MKPKYLPLTWVVFKFENSLAFGQIKSGFLEPGKEVWLYKIAHSSERDDASVTENDIVAVLQNDSWVEI